MGLLSRFTARVRAYAAAFVSETQRGLMGARLPHGTPRRATFTLGALLALGLTSFAAQSLAARPGRARLASDRQPVRISAASSQSEGAPDRRWVAGSHDGTIAGVAYAADGSVIATSGAGDYDRSLKLWNASTGSLMRTCGRATEGAPPWASPLTGTVLRRIPARRIDSPSSQRKPEIHFGSGRCQPVRGRWQCRRTGDSSLPWVTINLSTRGMLKPDSSAGSCRTHGIRPGTSAFSPDGTLLATASADNVGDRGIRVWRTADGVSC